MKTHKYLTTTQAAAILGLTRVRVFQLCREGKLPRCERLGRLWLVHPGDLDRLRKDPRGGKKEPPQSAPVPDCTANPCGEQG